MHVMLILTQVCSTFQGFSSVCRLFKVKRIHNILKVFKMFISFLLLDQVVYDITNFISRHRQLQIGLPTSSFRQIIQHIWNTRNSVISRFPYSMCIPVFFSTASKSSCNSSAKQNQRQSFCKASPVLRSPASTRSFNRFIHQT